MLGQAPALVSKHSWSVSAQGLFQGGRGRGSEEAELSAKQTTFKDGSEDKRPSFM